jgi:hypothetical protein
VTLVRVVTLLVAAWHPATTKSTRLVDHPTVANLSWLAPRGWFNAYGKT